MEPCLVYWRGICVGYIASHIGGTITLPDVLSARSVRAFFDGAGGIMSEAME